MGDGKQKGWNIWGHIDVNIHTCMKLFVFNVFVFMFLNEIPKWSV